MDDVVADGRNAWKRIRKAGRRSWGDWLCVSRALAQGRAEAMQAAKANRPFGAKYNKLFGEWLAENGLDGIDNQQRYRALLCLENLPAISAWRDGLPEAKRRTLNHPAARWHAWRRSAAFGGPALPKRQAVKSAAPRVPAGGGGSSNGGRPLFFSQDMVRRAGLAIGEAFSNDIFKMARVALEAAIRNEGDVDELLGERRVHARRGNGAAADHVAA